MLDCKNQKVLIQLKMQTQQEWRHEIIMKFEMWFEIIEEVIEYEEKRMRNTDCK